jgi:hypothetical protein
MSYSSLVSRLLRVASDLSWNRPIYYSARNKLPVSSKDTFVEVASFRRDVSFTGGSCSEEGGHGENAAGGTEATITEAGGAAFGIVH